MSGSAVRLWVVGLIVLAVVVAACVGSVPYTMGLAHDPADPNAPARPRYDLQALDANLLPPSWMGYSEEDRQRFDAYVARVEQAAAKGDDSSRPFYLLGTDQLGRDFFIRLLAGGVISLSIGVAAAAISVFIGAVYGMVAGYVGGRTDAIMMRLVDILYGLPYVLLVVLLAVGMDGFIEHLERAALEAKTAAESAGVEYKPPRMLAFVQTHDALVNLVTLLVAIGGVSWLTMARVIRGQVLSLKAQPFMEACRALGIPVRRQLLRHMLPNLLAPIIVYATLTVPQAILQESFLSFLGIGVRAPMPSWGNLAAEGLAELNSVESRWWLLFFPCLLLALTLLALNFLGEGLREAFDPRRRRGSGAAEALRLR